MPLEKVRDWMHEMRYLHGLAVRGNRPYPVLKMTGLGLNFGGSLPFPLEHVIEGELGCMLWSKLSFVALLRARTGHDVLWVILTNEHR